VFFVLNGLQKLALLENRWSQPGTFRVRIISMLLIVIVSMGLFVPLINTPTSYNFDETYYVPAAKHLLALEEPQNYEHPPLGKLIIATGVYIFGDQPVGWRAMSIIFGTLTLLGIYLLAHLIFQSQITALFVTALSLFNNFLYIQSRIAMLDIFMVTFMVWAAYFLTLAMKEKNKKLSQVFLCLGGAVLGLANSCKWFVLVFWVAIWLCIFMNWRRELRWKKSTLIFALGLTPVFTYLATFVPYLLVSPASGLTFKVSDLVSYFQWEIWSGQRRVTQSHPYMSPWYEWPLMIRPIWYFYEENPSGVIKGIALIGNPVVIWGGLLSLYWVIKDSLKRNHNVAKTIVFLYFVSTLSWIFIPRKVAFFYYYFPAVIVLGFALAYFFHERVLFFFANRKGLNLIVQLSFLALTIAMFIYFYPILSASSISRPQLEHRFWFQNWI
jgi:dolichyl-phosphate-mannose-protein mannosyltransferase